MPLIREADAQAGGLGSVFKLLHMLTIQVGSVTSSLESKKQLIGYELCGQTL